MYTLRCDITLSWSKASGRNCSFYSAGKGTPVNLVVNRCIIRLCSFQDVDNKLPNQVEILPLYTQALSTQYVHICAVNPLEPNCYCTYGPVLGPILGTAAKADGVRS